MGSNKESLKGVFFIPIMINFIQKFANGVISLAILANAASIPPALLSSAVAEQIIETGIESTALVARTPLEEGVKRMTVHITGYSSTPDQTDDTPFITAAGTHVRDGIVAANFVPLYTRIKIPELFGEKVFVVEDRMNRRFQNRVDIWFPDRASARKFGIKQAEIVVL